MPLNVEGYEIRDQDVRMYEQSNIVRSGLVLHLDASIFNTVTYGTTWFDLSGNGNNGTLTNGPTYSSIDGGIINFDGVDDYTNLGSPVSLRITQNVTISTWINVQAADIETVYRAIFGNASSQRNYNFYVLGNGAGSWCMHLSNSFDGNTTPYQGSLSDFVLQRNIWYNVVGIIRPDNNTHNYYVNGVLINSITTDPMGSLTTTTSEYWVGRSDTFFNGRVSIMQIYNRALTATEIAHNYNVTKGRFGL